MKRKTIDTIAGVINVLNSFKTMEARDIDELQATTGIPRDEIDDALKTMLVVARFTPRIDVDPDNGTILLIEHSPRVDELPPEDALVLHLFQSRAFDDASSCHDAVRFLNGVSTDGEYIVESTSHGFYLSAKGKARAQGILSSMHEDAGKFIDGNE